MKTHTGLPLWPSTLINPLADIRLLGSLILPLPATLGVNLERSGYFFLVTLTYDLYTVYGFDYMPQKVLCCNNLSSV